MCMNGTTKNTPHNTHTPTTPHHWGWVWGWLGYGYGEGEGEGKRRDEIEEETVTQLTLACSLGGSFVNHSKCILYAFTQIF